MFWDASLEELQQGYIEDKCGFRCLLCGKYFEKGIVYPEDGVIYESGRYVRLHIEKAHGSVFDYLLQLDKKLTGLTEHQKALLAQFYGGHSDKEIQKQLGIGSASTIRNHRFVLKEKERQAKLFLVMMQLLKTRDKYAPDVLNVHPHARMVDDRYNITQEENAQILNKYFPLGTEAALKSFPRREKQRLAVIRELSRRFEPDRLYTEKEINEILRNAYDDYVILRRYLIEYGFLDRKPDGSHYWLKT